MNIGILRRRVPYLIALVVLAAACFVAGNLVTERSSVRAQASAPDELAAPDGSGTCTIVDLGVFSSRIHVNCQAGVGGIPAGIHYFALSTSTPADARFANRVLALLTVAWAFGKHPLVAWTDSSASNPGGCLVADCRKLEYVVLK